MQEPLSYSTARAVIQSSLREALNEHKRAMEANSGTEFRQHPHLFMYIILPPTLCALTLTVSSIMSPEFRIDILITIIILILSMFFNLHIVWRVHASEKLEVQGEVHSMLEDYSEYLAVQATQLNHSDDNHTERAGILSGHPHVSIVTTYRNREWQRVPTLLLAEGDIVALMGGDVTPGRVWELHPVSQSTNASQQVPSPLSSPTSGSTYSNISSPLARGLGSPERPLKPPPGAAGGGIELVGGKSSAASAAQQQPKFTFLSSSQSSERSSEQSSERIMGPQKWCRGKLLNSGTKVLLRNHASGSTSSGSGAASPTHGAHRTVASDSVHLLILSGDIRCFQMAETPLKTFAKHLLGNSSGGSGSGSVNASESARENMTGDDELLLGAQSTVPRDDMPIFPLRLFRHDIIATPGDETYRRSSILRCLFHVILRKGVEFMLMECMLLIVGIIIKLSLVEVTRARWAETLLLPLVTTAMCFVPVSLPMMLLFAEAFVTADILTTTELILLGEEEEEEEEQEEAEEEEEEDTTGKEEEGRERGDESKEEGNPIDPVGQPSLKGLGNGSTMLRRVRDWVSEKLSRQKNVAAFSAETTRSEFTKSGYKRPAEKGEFRDDSSDDASDFDDDDIDERIEAEADEDRKVISTLRCFQYFVHVLRTRLGLHSRKSARGTESSFLIQQQAHRESEELLADLSKVPFLPVPLAKSRAMEVLGAVTMICFVDDDVICEPFSVCEEVFLLKPNAPEADADRGSTPSLQPTKGVVLDLHANPEATGSRFEDPLWWKYLNSLKPIGLNALLTHAPTPPLHFTVAGNKDVILTEAEAQLPPNLRLIPMTINRSGSSKASKASKLRRTTSTGQVNEASKMGAKVQSPALRMKQYSSEMQDGLVGHIRKAMPLEVLRELAEEIGFVDGDVGTFLRLLETNVIAPGLGDVKLLEDTHAWGQEDTRKRGTLFSHARGAIVQDSRGGGLQMMSQGDPALILNYCREYWDGSNITPFSSLDRKEVFSVYERWEMEDFDVIAFAYSPVPSSLKNLIVSAHQDNLKKRKTMQEISKSDTTLHETHAKTRRMSGGGGGRASISATSGDIKEANCLFFVDPRTAHQLQNPQDKSLKNRSSVSLLNTGIGGKSGNSLSAESGSNGGGGGLPPLHPGSLSLRPVASFGAMDKLAGETTKIQNPVLTLRLPSPPSRPSTSSYERDAQWDKASFENAASGIPTPADTPTLPRSRTGSRDLPLIPGPGYKRSTSDSALVLQLQPVVEHSVLTASIDSSQESLYGTTNAWPQSQLHSVSSSLDHLADRTDFLDDEEYEPGHIGSLTRNLPGGIAMAGGDIEISESSTSTSQESRQILFKATRKDSKESSVSDTKVLSSKNKIDDRDGPDYGLGDDDIDLEVSRDPSLEGSPRAFDDEEGDGDGEGDGEGEGDGQGEGDGEGEGEGEGEGDDAEYGEDVEYGEEELEEDAEPDEDDDYADADVDASMHGIDDLAASQHDGSLNGGYGRLLDLDLSEHPSRESEAEADDDYVGLDIEGGSSCATPELPYSSLKQDDRDALPPPPPITKTRSAEWNIGTDSAGKQKLDGATPRLLAPPGGASGNSGDSLSRVREDSIASNSSARNPILKAPSRDRTQSKSKLPKHPDASQRKQNKSLRRLTRSLGTSLWPLMRQQVFLGMAASSVPVKMEVPQLMEDLTAAGVRFVYFSPRNMRRSKPVAEKIGIQFDWNCAISLRELSTSTEHDPHRYISNYADWDVHARLPHGVPEIKRHLREVDNVPLLVSLYTDSTPATTQQMVEVFRSYGEVVLTVGSAYRASNSGIFQAANMAVSVNMLPGDQEHLHIHADSVLRGFPQFSDHSLARADLMLVFRLVSLGAVHLLQTPPTICSVLPSESAGVTTDSDCENIGLEAAEKRNVEGVLPGLSSSGAGPQLRMEALLEAVRKGRVLLLNMLQAIAMMCVSLFSLALWPLVSVMLPVAVPPSLSPAIAQLFLFIHVPFLLLAIINAPAPKNVLKSTPRKNIFNLSTKDEMRFTKYLLCRAGYTALCVFAIGWVSIASVANPGTWYQHMLERTDLLTESRGDAGVRAFNMVQDIMSIQLLLSLVVHALTLLERGQTWERPAIPSFSRHPTLYLCIIFILSTHAVVMGVRAWLRNGFQEYQNLDYAVWLILIVGTLGTFLVGLAVNAHDEKRHRRLMQFLRLDFDTKLGMHSPR